MRTYYTCWNSEETLIFYGTEEEVEKQIAFELPNAKYRESTVREVEDFCKLHKIDEEWSWGRFNKDNPRESNRQEVLKWRSVSTSTNKRRNRRKAK